MAVIHQLDLGHFTGKQGFLVFPVAVIAVVYRHRNNCSRILILLILLALFFRFCLFRAAFLRLRGCLFRAAVLLDGGCACGCICRFLSAAI